jgi:hypothetical protein
MVPRLIGIVLGAFLAYTFTKMANPSFELETWLASFGH